MIDSRGASPPSPDTGGSRDRGLALVTGATGFLGSHVVEALLAEGWRVRCTVRPTSDQRWIRSLPVERCTAELSSASQLAAILVDTDVVVHAAGVTRAKSDAQYHRVNAEATETLAAAALEAGVRRFVLVSSLAARGPDQRPGVEQTGEAPDRPTSVYGQSKLAGERRLFQALTRSASTMEAVILRPGGIYGPRDEGSLTLFRIARTGLLPAPAGPARLQPVFVKDVADAIVRASTHPGVAMGPFPLAGPEIVTWEALAEALARAIDRPVRLVRLPAPIWQASGVLAETAARLVGLVPQFDRRTADDLARLEWTADLREVETALGWRPRTALREAMSLTARWYRDHGWIRR